MPKFLDVPSWYNSRGILSYGVGVDTNEQPMVGDVPCVHLPSGELNWRRLMVNGATSGDISIYSPTSNPTGGQVLLSSGVGAPVWQDFDVNGAAIGAGATSIYAPTSGGNSGQLLASNGNNAPTWVSPYVHCVTMCYEAGSTSSSKYTSKIVTLFLFSNSSTKISDPNEIAQYLSTIGATSGRYGTVSSNVYPCSGYSRTSNSSDRISIEAIWVDSTLFEFRLCNNGGTHNDYTNEHITSFDITGDVVFSPFNY